MPTITHFSAIARFPTMLPELEAEPPLPGEGGIAAAAAAVVALFVDDAARAGIDWRTAFMSRVHNADEKLDIIAAEIRKSNPSMFRAITYVISSITTAEHCKTTTNKAGVKGHENQNIPMIGTATAQTDDPQP